MFDKLCNKIEELVKKYYLRDKILAVYCYGSFASNSFEKGYSDSDFWYIIKSNSVKERIELGLRISSLFDPEINNFINELNGADNSQKIVHGNLYFTENEFIRYCKAYPTRVIYPLKKNIWKIAYGKDYFQNIDLPSRECCIEYLQYDFDFFVYEFRKKIFSPSKYNIRSTIKYFLRAIRTVIWILEDTYIGTEQQLLNSAESLIIDEKLLCLFAQINKIKSSDYYILGEEYLNFYLKCQSVLEESGKKIKEYIIENGFQLMCYEKWNQSSLWGCFAWEMAIQSQWYSQIIGEKEEDISKADLQEIVIKFYEEYMRYIDEIILSKAAAQNVYFDKSDVPLRKSYILTTEKLEFNRYGKVLENQGFYFLLTVHAKNIIEEKFNSMNIGELKEYILNSFLPAIYEVYELLFSL